MRPIPIIALAERYAQACGLRLTTVAKKSAGQARLFDRLAAGHDITTKRAERVVRWLSDRWPADVEWPPEIPRPAPSPDVPLHRVRPADLVGTVQCALDRRLAAVDAGDWEAAKRAEREAYATAGALKEDGEIASPTALCLALHVERHSYDDVVRRYGRGHRPRLRGEQSDTARVLRFLEAAGDRRFTQETAA